MAWLLTGVLVINLALVVATVVRTDPETSVGYATVAAYRLADPLLLVLLAAVVVGAVLVDPVPRSGTLATTAAVVAGLVVLLGIGAALYGFTGPFGGLDAIAPLTGLVVSVVAVAVLIKAAALTRHRVRTATEGLHRLGPVAPTPVLTPGSPPTPEPDPQLQPTWQPDAAAGAAWMTAGDAAAGAPAAGWGSAESEFSGWRALPPGADRPGPGPESSSPTSPASPPRPPAH